MTLPTSYAVPKQYVPDYSGVRRLWKRATLQGFAAQQNRWHVAKKAYDLPPYQIGAAKKLAEAIAEAQGDILPDEDEKKPIDTVYRLANAYNVFVELLKMDCRRAMRYRRRYPYTRFDTVYKQWKAFEFEVEKLWDYLDYQGGNRAMAAFIENSEHPTEEWERRANRIYKEAFKLKDDFGVPNGLQKAAVKFVEEFSAWEKRATKGNL